MFELFEIIHKQYDFREVSNGKTYLGRGTAASKRGS